MAEQAPPVTNAPTANATAAPTMIGETTAPTTLPPPTDAPTVVPATDPPPVVTDAPTMAPVVTDPPTLDPVAVQAAADAQKAADDKAKAIAQANAEAAAAANEKALADQAAAEAAMATPTPAPTILSTEGGVCFAAGSTCGGTFLCCFPLSCESNVCMTKTDDGQDYVAPVTMEPTLATEPVYVHEEVLPVDTLSHYDRNVKIIASVVTVAGGFMCVFVIKKVIARREENGSLWKKRTVAL